MAAKYFIVMVAIITQVFGNPDTHVYSEVCKPPDGFEGNNTDVTTPDYVTLRPIERCCPQCDQCKEIGGYCALKWAVDIYPECCDFAPIEPCRDYSCKCCIKCGDDKCSPCVKSGGECRTECRPGELEDKINVCLYHNNGAGCKCCKRCEPTNECNEAEGVCVTNPEACPFGTNPSTGCCAGCYCCKPVLTPVIGGACETDGAYCSETDVCAAGFYSCPGECLRTLYSGGIARTELGYCCTPKQTGSPGASGRMKKLFIDPFHSNIDDHARWANYALNRHPRKLIF